MKNKKGFTIIEVLITSAIILILFALGLKMVFGAIQRAKNQAAAATISNINSMYGMAAAFMFLDAPAQYDTTAAISLPINAFSSNAEKAIQTHMYNAFSDLKGMKYTLVDSNGIEAEGGVTITYYPYNDKPDEFYEWVDGTFYRIHSDTQEQIK